MYSPRLLVPCESFSCLNSSRTLGTIDATLSVMDWLEIHRANWRITAQATVTHTAAASERDWQGDACHGDCCWMWWLLGVSERLTNLLAVGSVVQQRTRGHGDGAGKHGGRRR